MILNSIKKEPKRLFFCLVAKLNEKQFVEKETSYSGDILKERLKIYAKSMHKKARYTVEEKEEGGIKVMVYLPYILDV